MMRWSMRLDIDGREIAIDRPAYFIANIASAHDGELSRAKDLIWRAKNAGADAAKFEHFIAKDLICDLGFQSLDGQSSQRTTPETSVHDAFEKRQTPREWTQDLIEECAKADIDFISTPYDMNAIEVMAPHVCAFTISSGDVGWPQLISAVAEHQKPTFISTAAASMADVMRAVDAALAVTPHVGLMQSNANRSGDRENFAHLNLRVLQTYAVKYPGMVMGFCDHTPGHAAVLGAVSYGARMIEKHFTDDASREGPDHASAMMPSAWRDMVDAARELEWALGDGFKNVEPNETQAAMVERRCLRVKRNLPAGHTLSADDVDALRPCPEGAVEPFDLDQIIGRTLHNARKAGQAVMHADLDAASPDTRATG